ncbi:tubulin polyglutamylase TTLL6 [Sigmodon hispidus]
MLQCLTSESEEEDEERQDSSAEDLEELKEFVTLAFVRENTQKRPQNAQQHGKKRRKKKSDDENGKDLGKRGRQGLDLRRSCYFQFT